MSINEIKKSSDQRGSVSHFAHGGVTNTVSEVDGSSTRKNAHASSQQLVITSAEEGPAGDGGPGSGKTRVCIRLAIRNSEWRHSFSAAQTVTERSNAFEALTLNNAKKRLVEACRISIWIHSGDQK